MDSSNYHTHYLLGQAYKATGQLAEAEREMRQSVALQNEQSNAQGK
jgi:Flp pilus assembly protein TadD